jgi:hypothetical protein
MTLKKLFATEVYIRVGDEGSGFVSTIRYGKLYSSCFAG